MTTFQAEDLMRTAQDLTVLSNNKGDDHCEVINSDNAITPSLFLCPSNRQLSICPPQGALQWLQ